MKLYRLEVDSNKATNYMYKWEIEGFKFDRDFLFKLSITNQRLSKHLPDVICEKIVDETSTTRANFSRFMGVSVTFVLDEKAKTTIEDNFTEDVEFIPIKCEGETLYLLNVLEYADYDYNNLVRQKAMILAERKDGERQAVPIPTRVLKFAFKEDDVKGKNIFHPILDGAHKAEIFVSEEFKALIESNELTGFKFIEIWDSEE